MVLKRYGIYLANLEPTLGQEINKNTAGGYCQRRFDEQVFGNRCCLPANYVASP